MRQPPIKPNWLDRAIEIHNFHVNQCKDNSDWTITKSAELLNRSLGSVSQDLLLASWVKTHEKQLRRCSSMRDALAFVKLKQREMSLGEI
jgi:hypothetical protein